MIFYRIPEVLASSPHFSVFSASSVVNLVAFNPYPNGA